MPDDPHTVSEAVAILFSGDPATGESSCDVFRENEDDGLDPVAAAEAMRRHTQPDFPERLFSIAANDRARELMSERRMRELGIADA